MRALPDILKSAKPRALCAALGACGLLGAAAGCAGPAAPPAGDSFREVSAAEEAAPMPAPPAAGYAWDDLARRAAERGGEARALLLEAGAERRQAEVDTAWRAPQLRLGSRQGEADRETPGRLALRSDPLLPGVPAEPDMRPGEWESRSSDAYEVGLRVFISNPFVNRWLRKSGESAAQAKEAGSREAAYALACEVRSLCLEAASLREEIGVLEQIEAFRTQLRDIRSRQAAAGVAGALDLIRTVTRAAAIRSDLREKEAEHRQLVRRISLLADVPAEQIRLRPPAAENLPDAAVWAPGELVDLALSWRPDLARAEREQDAARHAVAAAKAGLLPWFDYVEGSYEGESTRSTAYEDYTTGYDAIDQDSTEWQLRLAVNIPIFAWDGKGVRLAQARLAAGAARAQALRAQIRTEIAGVRKDYLRACAERDRLAAECQQVRDVMTAKIDALAQESAVKQEDLLAAREEIADYGRILLRADLECRRLALELESVVGGPLAPAP